MSDKSQTIAFWLLPESGARAELERVVRDLAQRFDAPLFQPHVTLQGADVDEGRAREVLPQICAASEPVELEVDRIAFSEKYTKTLSVQFRPSAAASALSDAVREALGCTSDYEFDPHLSLIYKEMPESTKAGLARSITLPFTRMVCDAVKVISTTSPITTSDEVEAWRTIGECSLR